MYAYEFGIEGLNCSVCGAKIEKELQREKLFHSAVLDFMAKRIKVESQDPLEEKRVQEVIDKKIKLYEHGVKLYPIEKIRERYHLIGLHCSDCARKIEVALLEEREIEKVLIDMAQGTLLIEGNQITPTELYKKVSIILNTIDSKIKIKDFSFQERKENIVFFIRFGISFLLLISLLFFQYGEIYQFWIALLGYLIIGYDVLLRALQNIRKKQLLDEHFLMTFATIGAFGIGEYPEAIAVMLFYQIGEWFQKKAVEKSRKSITSILSMKAESVTVQKGKEYEKRIPRDVSIGEIILVKPGEMIPLDGVIIQGKSALDTKALTGESLPREVKEEDFVYSGMVNQESVLFIQVTKEYSNSMMSKIIEIVQNSTSRKAKTEQLITKIAKIYTPLVVAGAILLTLVPTLIFGISEFSHWFQRSLIFLVISCPCALVVSIPLSYFAGIGVAAKNGILVKGSTFLDSVYRAKTVMFDKTGTLTEGSLKISGLYPAKGVTENQLLEGARRAECFSNHPIAKTIVGNWKCEFQLEDVVVTEIAGEGILAKYPDGTYGAGKLKFLENRRLATNIKEVEGTVIYVTKENSYLGAISFLDDIKSTAAKAIKGLRKEGVKQIYMLSGDAKTAAKEIAEKLLLDGYRAELLPEGKIEAFSELKKDAKNTTIFVGDGINDAPLLSQADVGISMGQVGQDIAIEASDIVIMKDDLMKLVQLKQISMDTRHIILQNIIFVFFIKFLVMGLGAAGIANMWSAIFSDVGVSLIAIVNGIRIFNKKYDE